LETAMDTFQGYTFHFEWEVAAQEWLQSLIIDSPIGTAIVSFITYFGEQLVLIVVLGFLYWWFDKDFGKFVWTNILVGTVVNPMLKNVAFRRRPYFDNPGIKILKPVVSSAPTNDIKAVGYSFPSGHTTNSTILYGSLPVYKKNNKALLVVAFVAPFLVGLSRVMLGAHYITDVLVGWALGALVIFLVSYLQRRVKREWLLHLVIAIVCIPGFFYCQTADYYISYGMMIGFFLANAFEKRFVNFKSTRSVVRGILRLLGGATLYFGLNALFKYICELIFSEEFLASASLASFAIITVRYAIIMFLIIGVYPLAFDRIGTPKAK